MAVFQCPYCYSALSAGELRPGTAMKCPKCAGEFVYQGPAADTQAFSDGSSKNWLRETFGNRGIQMLIGLVLATAGAIVMIVIAAGHSSQEQPAPAAPAPVAATPGPKALPVKRQLAAQPEGDATIPTDPGLTVSADVGTDPGGNAYAFGTVLNTFDVPLDKIHLRVYVKGAAGPTGECLFAPPKTALRFSIPLGAASDALKRANIVVSALAEASPEGTVMWSIPDTAILRGVGGDSRIWTGETSNPTQKRIGDVGIYCDFYSRDGLQACFASAKLDEASILPGQRMQFSLRCEDVRAESAETVVARAVARIR